MSEYGVPPTQVNVIKQMIESGAWHAANLKAGWHHIFDSWKDFDNFTDAVEDLLEPAGGVFTKSLAETFENCMWHTAWYTVHTKYGNTKKAESDLALKNEVCNPLKYNAYLVHA